MTTITIDASHAGSGVDFKTYLTTYYGGLVGTGTSAFYGGTEDAAPFGYQNGSQVGFRFKAGGLWEAGRHQVLAEGSNLAYDYAHYGPAMNHGISGTVDSLMFGYYNDATTPANGTAGPALLSGYVTDLRISGLGISSNPGEGPTGTNAVYMLYSTLRMNGTAGGLTRSKDDMIASLYQTFSTYSQHFIGSGQADKYDGSAQSDTIEAGGGNDRIGASAGQDEIDGGAGSDVITFAGARSDYTITGSFGGTLVVTRDGSTDATTIRNGELARFSDVAVSLLTGAEVAVSAPPAHVRLTTDTVTENAAVNAVIGKLTADQVAEKGITFALASDSDGRFALVDDTIVLKGSVNYETARTHSITVVARDLEGGETTQVITIHVGDANEAPADIVLSKAAIREGAEVGTRVGILSAVDPEGSALTYALASNPGGSFKISGNQLLLAKVLDYDKVQGRTIAVEVKDASGASLVKAFRIDVTDRPEAKSGTAGNDVIKGAAGIEIMRGGEGHDRLSGLGGNDSLYGGAGDDNLNGGAGFDLLRGDAGGDRLYGAAGADRLFGGSGADTFVFKSIAQSTIDATGRDVVSDFSRAQGDRIDLSGIDANVLRKGNQAFSFIGQKAFQDRAGELRYEKDGAVLVVQGDVNGDGNADFSIAVKGTPFLTKGYFVL
ncbi:MAG: hypothetical protein ABWY78_07540 [Microvirga sp.]